MANNPTLLTQPIAANGAKNVIPNTTSTAGAMSQDQGFPAETALPLGAGGVAPSREDFNGAFNLLGGIAFYAQKGWTFEYDATQDYYKGCIVIDPTDGKRYECIADVSAGGSVPSADTTHWKIFIDITQYEQELATKANRQLSNLDTANLACHVVVDSYYNSSTGDWYRVYDDGWVEQGGKESHTGSYNFNTTINLLKPMADNNYDVQITPISNTTETGGLAYGTVYTVTTTQLSYSIGAHSSSYNNGIGSYWKVAGMGASV